MYPRFLGLNPHRMSPIITNGTEAAGLPDMAITVAHAHKSARLCSAIATIFD